MPRFPFKRSVGQDLRDLFTHDRLKQQERALGYSSISPGEGATEIRDAGGAALAQFGYAAGKAGFLVQRGGSWVTVQEWAAAEVAAGTASLTSRMTTAEGRLDDHATRIGAAENDINDVEAVNATQNGRLDAHAVRLGRHENDMETIDGKLVSTYNSLEARVAELEEPGKIGNPISPTPITKG